MAKYKVVFSGEITQGHNLEDVKTNLNKKFKLGSKGINKIFSGKPIAMKKNLSRQAALDLKAFLEQQGVVCRLKPQQVQTPGPTLQKNIDPVPASPQTNQLTCPKCEFQQPESLECVKCGVIFRKHSKKAESLSPAPAYDAYVADESNYNIQESASENYSAHTYSNDAVAGEAEPVFTKINITFSIIGIIMMIHSLVEIKVTSEIGASPELIEQKELENGLTPSSKHIQIDQHLRLYPASVFIYTDYTFGLTGGPRDSTGIEYILYPVVSPEHSIIYEINEGIEKIKRGEISEHDPITSTGSFTVLVKSTKFKHLKEIPLSNKKAEDLTGYLSFKFKNLEIKAKELVLECFPRLDTENLIIIEEDRAPPPATSAIIRVIVSVLILTGSLASIFPYTVKQFLR